MTGLRLERKNGICAGNISCLRESQVFCMRLEALLGTKRPFRGDDLDRSISRELLTIVDPRCDFDIAILIWHSKLPFCKSRNGEEERKS